MQPPPSGVRGGKLAAVLPRAITAAVLILGGAAFLIPEVRAFVAEAASRIAAGDGEGVAAALRRFRGHAWLVSTALMLLQGVAAPIPALPITLANAMIYGPWLGCLLSWGSAQLAALLCFWLARAMGRPFVERLVSRRGLIRFDAFFERNGTLTVVVARLLPVVPFDLVSYAAGLTGMRALPFFLATGLGQFPASVVYSHVGAEMLERPSHALWLLLAFLALIALGAALLWWWHAKRKPRA